MAFLIKPQILELDGYEELKNVGDEILEDKDLSEYVIEIRPATEIEENAVAGKGLAPGKDSGDNFVPDTSTMVVYRTESVPNPLLEKMEQDASNVSETAEVLVERLAEHVENYN